MSYKEEIKETEERKRFDDESEDEYSYEEEPFSVYVKRILEEIGEKVGSDPQSKPAATLLSTLSNELSKESYEFDNDEFSFIVSLVFGETLLQTKENAVSCITAILENDSSKMQALIEMDILNNLLQVVFENPSFASSNQLYSLLTAIAHSEFAEYAFERFPLALVNDISSKPGFVYNEEFFEYLSCFLNLELDEEGIKIIQSIFSYIMNRSKGTEKYMPSLYKLAGKMGEKHLVNPDIWNTMNNMFKVWSISALVQFFKFVQTMALEECFFVNIDLDHVLMIIKEMKDDRILREAMYMLSCLCECDEFYTRLKETEIVHYVYEAAVDSGFEQKEMYAQLLIANILRLTSEITDFDVECLSFVLDLISGENNEILIMQGLEAATHLCKCAEKISEELFNQIIEEIIDIDPIVEFSQSENKDLAKLACDLLEAIHYEE